MSGSHAESATRSQLASAAERLGSWNGIDRRKKVSPPPVTSNACRKTVLENGIRVVTEQIPGSSCLAIGLLVECGSRDEEAGESGLAHLCEHLLFQGTSNRDALQVARQIDLAGGQIGAFTTRDYTCYHAAVLGDYCYHALDLLADVILNFTIPEASLEREKLSIIHEIGEKSDVPARCLQDLVKSGAWKDHPAARPVSGEQTDVERYTREDLIYFLHKNYTPDRIIIGAAGQLSHDDFTAQVRDAFWRMLGESRSIECTAARFHAGAEVTAAHTSQIYITLALPAPAYASAERYGYHVLDRILGGGVSSRLFRRLREEKGWVYHVSSEYQAYRDGGMLVIDCSTSGENVEAVLGSILECVNGLAEWTEPVTEEELLLAKNGIRAQYLMASEDVHVRMCRLATQEFYFGRHLDSVEILNEIDRVGVGSIERLASEILGVGMGDVFAGIAGPASEEQSRRWRELVNSFRSVAERHVSGPGGATAGSPISEGRR